MKKLLSLLLVVSMLLSITAVAYAAKFSDVDSNYAWAEEAIEDLSEKKIITGYEDGTFKPGKSVTRQEAIALFSRVLGASAESNEEIVNFAYGIYAYDLRDCATSYAVKQGAYLIYRKILTVDEVVKYLSAEKANIELKRYEAAALIAKALDADSWLENNKDVERSLSYVDTTAIPVKYVNYVFYTTSLGIMGEMGDNKFGPNEAVTRAQIAVMIKRIADMMEFKYIGGVVETVDTEKNILTLKAADDKTTEISTNDAGAVYIDAKRAALSDIKEGMKIAVILSKDKLYQIDAISYTENGSISGAYNGKSADDIGITVKIADVKKEDTVTSIRVASNAVLSVNGEDAENLDAIADGDYVIAQISDGLIVKLTSQPKDKIITGVKVANINGETVTVADENGAETDYTIGENVRVMRNSALAQVKDLLPGDEITITFEYGAIKKVEATGVVKVLEGIVEEFTISSGTSYITISKGASEMKYVLSRNCSVTLNGEEVTIYGLRVGAYVKLDTEGETVVSVETNPVEVALQLTGTIKEIDATKNTLMLEVTASNGEVSEKQLSLKDSVKIINSVTGEELNIKDLKVGDVITAAGVDQIGVYIVSTLMLLQQA